MLTRIYNLAAYYDLLRHYLVKSFYILVQKYCLSTNLVNDFVCIHSIFFTRIYK